METHESIKILKYSIMRGIISIFIVSVFALSGYAQYSGKVFVDENDNGIYDSGEKLLKGIKGRSLKLPWNFIVHNAMR